MPIYEYQCQDCDHYLDVLQKIGDEPLTFCPECGKARLKKLVSAPSFRLKGSGWYETDFKKDNKRNLADGGKSDGKSDSKSDGKDKPKSDAAPDSKPQPAAAKSDSGSATTGKSGSASTGKSGGDST